MSDRDAARLYLANRAELVRYAARIVGSRTVAEDVVQDAYLRFSAQSTPDATRDGAPERILEPVRYLNRIVRNLALDWLRRPRQQLASEVDFEALEAVACPLPSPEDAASSREQMTLVEQALASLPPRTRAAFEMHRHGGRTLQEVARELGISTTRAHQLVKDAMTRCADRLDEGGGA